MRNGEKKLIILKSLLRREIERGKCYPVRGFEKKEKGDE